MRHRKRALRQKRKKKKMLAIVGSPMPVGRGPRQVGRLRWAPAGKIHFLVWNYS